MLLDCFNKLQNSEESYSDKINDFNNFWKDLEAKIDLAIYEIESNVLRKFENIKLSEAETKKVEDQLVKLQLNLLEN